MAMVALVLPLWLSALQFSSQPFDVTPASSVGSPTRGRRLCGRAPRRPIRASCRGWRPSWPPSRTRSPICGSSRVAARRSAKRIGARCRSGWPGWRRRFAVAPATRAARASFRWAPNSTCVCRRRCRRGPRRSNSASTRRRVVNLFEGGARADSGGLGGRGLRRGSRPRPARHRSPRRMVPRLHAAHGRAAARYDVTLSITQALESEGHPRRGRAHRRRRRRRAP